MHIKQNNGLKYPSMIQDFLDELSKNDFTYFQLSCENEIHSFYNENDSTVEFKQGYLKETDNEGELFFLDYSKITAIVLSKTESKDEKDEFESLSDDDWTGHRIQF
ncbi:hypothetical protein [uncultured Methanobrevibacter sp.]|uniref:hypothetical protein n=2 Tax=uncultured Methanobrevibacter sp. TaxID=253161 RepID=UPI0025F8C1C9|nr:hypothetical protein [uncultured Methanobrevibacter sp.]